MPVVDGSDVDDRSLLLGLGGLEQPQTFIFRSRDAAQACADTYPAQATVPHHAPNSRARRADPTRELIWALISWGDDLRARCGAPTLAGRAVLVHQMPLGIGTAQYLQNRSRLTKTRIFVGRENLPA